MLTVVYCCALLLVVVKFECCLVPKKIIIGKASVCPLQLID